MTQPAARRGSTRTKARKRALDILFEADLRGTAVLAALESHTEQAEPPVRPFTAELVRGVERHRTQIDQYLAESLAAGWSLERMPRVDRNLARLAIYEIVYTDLADEIALAECIGLSEELSTDSSPQFLNGLLSALLARKASGTL
ncbi:MAG: transcription antitermination factor NusB [Propionibacteriaceae bacterium]|jgi:N utilization substance protein B|nr:transcription antitermination factor NusB [Propionibacteriaceae bacterium]